MKKLERVLAATDGSERAEEAVRQGARLAAAFGASLLALFVIERDRPHDGDVEREAEAALERARAIAASAGSSADARIVGGDVGDTLVAEAESGGIDLLCIGPDAGALGGALRVGRVAAHLLREATCSTLVARPAADAFPERILCGVDGSEESGETALEAATIAASTRAELRLLHVVPVFRGDNSEWTLDPDEAGPPELEPAVTAATSRGVIAVREMAMGRPEHALLAVAERDACDLVVVGHRGISGMRRVLLGSVSEHVAHHAKASVLVARGE
jgi:nucleotide-binding universal stress UspA family protein